MNQRVWALSLLVINTIAGSGSWAGTLQPYASPSPKASSVYVEPSPSPSPIYVIYPEPSPSPSPSSCPQVCQYESPTPYSVEVRELNRELYNGARSKDQALLKLRLLQLGAQGDGIRLSELQQEFMQSVGGEELRALEMIQRIQVAIAAEQGLLPEDPFKEENCGNCKCPHCESVEVTCVADKVLQLLVGKVAGACDRASCELFLSDESICKPLGIQTVQGPLRMNPAEPPALPPINGAQSALAYCMVLHELNHGCDSDQNCPHCGSEVKAYQKSQACLNDFWQKHCSVAASPADSWLGLAGGFGSCSALAQQIAHEEKAEKLNACLCKHRIAGTTGLYPAGTCESCRDEAGLGLDIGDVNLLHTYCSLNELAAPPAGN